MIGLTMKSYLDKYSIKIISSINIDYFVNDDYPAKKVEFLESTDTVRLVLRFTDDPFEFKD